MSNKNFNIINPPATIGIIGGGQLGKMISAEAKRMGYNVTVLDPTPNSPAAQVSDNQIIASFYDKSAIKALAESCSVLTYEFEHIDSDILVEIEKAGYNIIPSGKTLQNIQDKYTQKMILKNANIKVPDFFIIENFNDINNYFENQKLPLIIKTRFGGYDGKGNFIIKTTSDIDNILKVVELHELKNFMAEKFIEFEKELSIIVVRDLKNNYTFYPVVQNIHKDSILHFTKVPADISLSIENKAKEIAQKVLEVFDDYGVFCIEMFLTKEGELYVNEIAPRPHNSGHYTIEACVTSQFEQLIRVITGMPLGSSELISPCVMSNILGNDSVEGLYMLDGIQDILSIDNIYLHLYGKQFTKKLKKLGHFTVLGKSVEQAEEKAKIALKQIQIKPYKYENINNSINSSLSNNLKVGIIMGSDSDLPIMSQAAKILKELKIDFEINVVSAHRTPEKMFNYARTAESRGISVIIAGAGGAAHLPGMVAAITCIPVIGVPIELKNLKGLDSFLSIAQMPTGIPVATVSINGAAMAGFLAARILGIKNLEIRQRIVQYLNSNNLEIQSNYLNNNKKV